MRATLFAAFIAVGMAGAASAGPLAVPLNHSVRLALSGSAGSVVVGNPAIADVTVVDSRTLFVSGKSIGSTNVIVVDGLGRTIYNADVAVGAPRRGHVAVYRGGDKDTVRTDLACSPLCEVAVKGADPSSSSALPSTVSAAPMPAPATN